MKNLYDVMMSTIQVVEPPERLTVSQAAEKYRVLNNPGAYAGPWKNDTVPYMIEPMDVLSSREYTGCIFVGPAQSGKTDALILNPILHSVVCDPADMIVYQTSQSVARDFSKRRIDRLHRYSTEVGGRLLKRGDADNTHDKHYTSGVMLTLSWPTINELSGRPVGRVYITDYDRIPLDIDGEGNAFDLGRKRTTTYGSFAMTLAESSPGYSVNGDDWVPSTPHEAPPAPGILALYNRGDRRRWYWPCHHCGEYYRPEFKLLKWVDSKDISECAQSASMVCPHCGCLMTHDLKYQVNNEAIWVPDGMKVTPNKELIGEHPKSDIASFWLKGVSASFAKWETLVTNYIKAEREFDQTGDQQALKSTVNTDQGDPYYPRGTNTTRRAEDIKDQSSVDLNGVFIPDDVRFLIATIDVQGNRFEVQVHGVIAPPDGGMMTDTLVIERFVIKKSNRFDEEGDRLWVNPGKNLEDWDLITEKVINKTYPLADGSGRKMQIKMTGCDSGGKEGVTSMAYNYWGVLRKNGLVGKFMLVKGTGTPGAPRTMVIYPDSQIKGVKASLTGQIPLLQLQTDKWKDHLNNLLDRTEPGGRIQFNNNLPDSFFTELTVESKNDKGKWENPKKLRNESWDLLVYFFAIIQHLGIDHINWSSPPSWASEHDENTLVSEKDSEIKFAPNSKNEYDLIKSLGDQLG